MTSLRSHLARSIAVGMIALIVQGCATTAPTPAPKPADTLSGVASWYGEEFAGKTTANGEIFDPQAMTAAHRTLPFGTILEVRNPANAQTVTVRVNDRGPFVGNRVLDLSWGAAKQIGLVEPGIGPVEIKVVKIGAGDREPPVPFDVVIKRAPELEAVPPADRPPEVPFPLPGGGTAGDVVVDRVEVVEQRGQTPTRRVVAADGQTFESQPIQESPRSQSTTPASTPPQPSTTARPAAPAPASRERFFVQAGAFASQENATALQQRLEALGHRAWVDTGELYRVRIGPFTRREDAVAERAKLEANGLSALIVTE